MHVVTLVNISGTMETKSFSTNTYTIREILSEIYGGNVPASVISKTGSQPNAFQANGVKYGIDENINVDSDITIMVTANTSGAL